MIRAAIYSRVDPTDRASMPQHQAASEALCKARDWTFTHYTDSASGNRPPLQFATQSQMIRSGLTRLLSAIEAQRVDAVIPSTPDALGANTDIVEKLTAFLEQHGFKREDYDGEPSFYYVRS